RQVTLARMSSPFRVGRIRNASHRFRDIFKPRQFQPVPARELSSTIQTETVSFYSIAPSIWLLNSNRINLRRKTPASQTVGLVRIGIKGATRWTSSLEE